MLGLLNSYFFQSAIDLPNSVKDNLFSGKSKLRLLRVVLDTNFLFSLFSLHANPSNEAVDLLVKTKNRLPENVGIRLYVLPGTISEFRKSLISYENSASQIRTAKVIVDAGISSHLSSVLETYLERVKASNYSINAKDYFAPFHEDIRALLAEHGVEVLSGAEDGLAEDQKVIDDALDQVAFYKKKFPSEPWKQKNYDKIWHDMCLWHIIERRRPDAADTVFSAEWIGCTIDYALIAFDGHKRYHKGIPYMAHPAALVQALQLIVPNDEELSSTILALMQMPFLFETFDSNDEKVTRKILSSLSRFENVDDLSTDTVTTILGDRALRGKLEVVQDRDQEFVLVRDALVAHSAAIEAERAELAGKLRDETALRERQLAESSAAQADQHHKVQTEVARASELEEKLRGLEEQGRREASAASRRTAKLHFVLVILSLSLVCLLLVLALLQWQTSIREVVGPFGFPGLLFGGAAITLHVACRTVRTASTSTDYWLLTMLFQIDRWFWAAFVFVALALLGSYLWEEFSASLPSKP